MTLGWSIDEARGGEEKGERAKERDMEGIRA